MLAISESNHTYPQQHARPNKRLRRTTLVITKFGLDAWHAIKQSANCTVKDYGFEQHGSYPESATVDIVVAAARALMFRWTMCWNCSVNSS
jgi:hypothetical protein